MIIRILGILILVLCGHTGISQLHFKGEIIDSKTNKPLAYVNIGIKEKNIGTTSSINGSFAITIPSERQNDTLTFSAVGYHQLNIPVNGLLANTNITIPLLEKVMALDELVITGEKLVKKKYGIKKRGLIHFTDGIFENNDSFEIGQLINLGNMETQITDVNLHINISRPDSASFRINFYGYDENDNRPAERIVEKSILQRHAIQEGWLKFDLIKHNILLKGKVFVSIEFIPEHKVSTKQILYEVKIGGASKSFFRRNSLGQWNIPPHHYCLYVSALVDKNTAEEPDDIETAPAIIMQSEMTKESYSIFIKLPKGYTNTTNSTKKYPVVYHLDGNAYFDPISSALERLRKKKKISIDPILVGIGYKNAYVMDSLRDRDYTFPEALSKDSFQLSGGGERFYEFITTELKPYIEKTYRTDTAHQTIMGHSLGGYFVLYALLKNANGKMFFHNYVAASPSLSYGNNYIIEGFQKISPTSYSTMKTKLYLTIGELEIAEDQEGSFNDFRRLLFPHDLQLSVNIYSRLEHMGTAIPSFEDGIEFVLAEQHP